MLVEFRRGSWNRLVCPLAGIPSSHFPQSPSWKSISKANQPRFPKGSTDWQSRLGHIEMSRLYAVAQSWLAFVATPRLDWLTGWLTRGSPRGTITLNTQGKARSWRNSSEGIVWCSGWETCEWLRAIMVRCRESNLANVKSVRPPSWVVDRPDPYFSR